MRTHHGAAHWLSVLLLSAALGSLIAVVPASPAAAHAVLLETDPGGGSIIDTAPTGVGLRFSEKVSPTRDQLAVLAPDGESVARGRVQARDSGRGMWQPLAPDLGRGTYVVSYRVISADGHPIAGGFTFSVLEPSTPARQIEPGASAANQLAAVDPVVRLAVWVGRYAGYVGAALLAGVLVMAASLWPRRLGRWVLTPMAVSGWALSVFAALGSLLAEIPYAYGGSLTAISGEQIGELLNRQVGVAYLIRLALLVAMLPLLWRFLRAVSPVTASMNGARTTNPTTDRWVRALLLGCAAAATLTWPLSGHAATGPGWQLGVIAAAAHVGAAAIWLGGLVVLVAALLRRRGADGGELAALTPVWSRWALRAVVVIAVTGSLQTLLRLDASSDLLRTEYGRLLLVKVVGVVAVIAVAGWSRRLVAAGFANTAFANTAFADDARAAAGPVSRLRRAVGAELALGALVLVAATLLVNTPPPQQTVGTTASDGQSYTATARSGDVVVQTDLDPARRGNNSIHLTAFSAEGAPLPVLQWTVSVALPEAGIEPISVPLPAISDSHVVGEVALPMTGQWRLRIVLRLSDVEQTTIDQKIPIGK